MWTKKKLFLCTLAFQIWTINCSRVFVFTKTNSILEQKKFRNEAKLNCSKQVSSKIDSERTQKMEHREISRKLNSPLHDNYLYLNYKEAYGIRYNPSIDNNEKLSPQMAASGSMINETVANMSNTIPSRPDPSVEPPTESPSVPITPTILPIEISTRSPPQTATSIIPATMSTATMPLNNTLPSLTTESMITTTGLAINTPRSTHKRPGIAFPSLAQHNQSFKQNATSNVQSGSTLRGTLNLIRRRIKQWFSSGIDLNASLVNGQRFLNVFNVINFENDPCTSTQAMLTEMTGTCYHDYQCSDMGGTSIDSCADGLGVCCIFKVDCGQKTRQITSYFQNPNWPEASQDRIICTLTVELQSNVVQILIEFLTFELMAPTDGNCADDQFIVAGQNLNNRIPTICGVNSGHHMYVEVDNAMNGKIFLSILTAAPAARAYNIRVTQLKDSLAPSNCLQYYTDAEGWIQTFNYDDTSQFVSVRNPTYFNNLNYAICIKRQSDSCSITYTNEVDEAEYDFQLVNVDGDGTSVIPEKQAGIEIFSCNDDFISVNSIRLCGEKLNDASRIDDLTLNSPIIDTNNGPFVIPLRTNEGFVGRGFRINYKQMLCQPSVPSVEEPVEEEIVTEFVDTKKRFKNY